MKIKVYYLINPITDNPFYVGITKGSLEDRLKSHWSSPISTKKMIEYRNVIKEAKRKVEIRLIEEVDISIATDTEKRHYNLLVWRGFELINNPKYFTHPEQSKHGK